jgi:N-acetylglucosaminyldiphosphoundecaprenol N-acetyl-beta-D-mannosaminyltransferase
VFRHSRSGAMRVGKMRSTYPGRERGLVVGIPIDAVGWLTARQTLCNWAIARESRYVCICNVHSVVTASRDNDYRRVIYKADMATPDGAPVAWTLRRKGFAGQDRINGPDLMWKLCEDALRRNIKVGLLGSTPETLQHLHGVLGRTFTGLDIAFCVSPAAGQLTHEEDHELCESINASGVGLLFVGLGCPKQELWMYRHRGRVSTVMIGVGAAFNYHAGTISRAPVWMQASGLEWLYRLMLEPRRLWRRYFVTNSLFIVKTACEWAKSQFSRVR